MPDDDIASIAAGDPGVFYCLGRWTVTKIAACYKQYPSFAWGDTGAIVLDLSKIETVDTAGAWLLHRIVIYLKNRSKTVEFRGVAEQVQVLLDIVGQYKSGIMNPPEKPKKPGFLYFIGAKTVRKYHQAIDLLAFMGELVMLGLNSIRMPSRFQYRSFVRTIELTGNHALPIIALLTFLVGVVLAYQLGLQLRNYGAEVYIVSFSGIAVLREFGPLITAIIVAGRSGSSFTAKLGMMKVNEEVDALRTMGISPSERLVLPTIMGLMVAFPLVTLWADAFGVMGSMVMAKIQLEIGYLDFLTRFETDVPMRNYWIGMLKAPVFASIIAGVGCFQGFQVASNAESVGLKTTKSVVQAIFLIIIVDAIFSVTFSWQSI